MRFVVASLGRALFELRGSGAQGCRGLHAAVFVGLAAAPAAYGVGGQSPVFNATAELKRLHFTVRAQDGSLETGLAASRFTVLVDGKPAEIQLFSSAPRSITAVAMIDVSRSMAPHLMWARNTAGAFIDALELGDRVQIGSFGAELALSPHLTSDRQLLRRVLTDELWPGGGTPLWDAVSTAATAIRHESPPRSVVVISDGRAEATGHARSGAVEALVADETLLYGVGRDGPGLGALRSAAVATGGGFVELDDSTDTALAMRRLAHELRNRYLIGIAVPRDGPVRDIRILLDGRPVVRVRS